MCIAREGQVYTFGKHEIQTHALEDYNVFSVPTVIPSLCNIKFICCRFNHALCLCNDGKVYSFGNNSYGKLGIGYGGSSIVSKPILVNLPPIKEVSCGVDFSICLSEEGYLYSFGNNKFGQLGLGTKIVEYFLPQKIATVFDVDFIECGDYQAICRTLEGDLYAWGINSSGQLGAKHRFNIAIPTKCKVYPRGIVDIKCGNKNTLLLTDGEEVYSCGDNQYGQLGRPTVAQSSTTFQKLQNLTGIVRIECGHNHCMCIDKNNDFYVFGNNENGQLGLGDLQCRKIPVKHTSLSNIIDFSSGGNHTLVKTSENKIFAFGASNYSQLGRKLIREFQMTPLQVLQDNEDIWFSNIKSKAKSARF